MIEVQIVEQCSLAVELVNTNLFNFETCIVSSLL